MGGRKNQERGRREEQESLAVVVWEDGDQAGREREREREDGREKQRAESNNFGCSFFKVLLPERFEERLMIPSSFSQYLQDQPAGMISLKGQSGNTWGVELASDSKGFFFGHGWNFFVRDHSIEHGIEKMSARYAQPSKDLSVKTENDEGDNAAATSQKMTPLAKKSNKTTRKRTRDTEVANRSLLKTSESNGLENAKKKHAHAVVGTSKAALTSHNSTEDSSDSSSGEDISCNKSPEISMLCSLSKDVPRQGKLSMRGQRQLTVLSQRRPVTEAEKDRALERAKGFKSKNPFALQIMMASYVYVGFFMHIPCEFVRECLPRTSKKLTLWDPQGKAWEVNYVYYSDRSVGSFSGGWGKFAIGNNLEKFDVCVFELVQKDNIKVHIYRVVPEITPQIIRTNKK
ncbi:hypothetical protein GUJ93_ZPchr0011g27207 [Zizania palustris]|uniref:TF-B3 domain-containing protein n=1 Tax=Zizania palustris TaxID=103762 RepID=A0A8J5WJJ9_ZIZPA|nr:hypothetical protein GUJ93_ZPchr0011g27207 [Zizania palustris]